MRAGTSSSAPPRRQWRRSVRGWAKGAMAVPYSLFCWALATGGSLALGFAPRARARWQGRIFRLWSHGLVRIFGVRVRVEGEAPPTPFFLVANHLSYVDIVVLGTEVPCVFVAKGELDTWPLFGALCRSVNTIFIDRKLKRDIPRVLAEIESALAVGQGVVVFPESTSSAGASVLPFRASLLELPARLGLPVHHATLSYRVPESEPSAFHSVAWWGNAPFLGHVSEFLKLGRVEASIVFGDAPVSESDRKLLAERLQAEVLVRFSPLVSAEALSEFEPPWDAAASAKPPD